jgi:microcystin-dependent protein
VSDPYLAEIRLMSFSYAPRGWAHCNGQLLPINQNQALFSLLGTMYGGNGTTNFALPDLRGRVPVHVGAGHTQGERAGEYAHTLTAAELPQHTHAVGASSAATGGSSNVNGRVLGGANNAYHSPSNLVALHPQTVASTGGSQPHQNTAPSLTLSFCIALQGIFPTQS